MYYVQRRVDPGGPVVHEHDGYTDEQKVHARELRAAARRLLGLSPYD
jgi:hypothetical protein